MMITGKGFLPLSPSFENLILSTQIFLYHNAIHAVNLKTRGYLGIDESNHGRYPEVFVGVYSTYYSDIVENTRGLPKIRDKKQTIEQLINDRSFRYILVPEIFGKELGASRTTLVVLYEFIAHFKNIEQVIVDGNHKSEAAILENLGRLLHPEHIPKISFVIKGDTKFGLVNLADSLANYLNRHHLNHDGIKDEFSKYLVQPNFKNYIKYSLVSKKGKYKNSRQIKIRGCKNVISTAIGF